MWEASIMPKRKKKISKREARKWFVSAAIITAVILIGAIVGTVIGAVINIPTWSPETLYGSETTTLYDRNNKTFYSLHAEENRIQVPLSLMPEHLKQAFIAVEDREFYNHHGINVLAIARAVIVDIVAGKKAQGASTITQQLAKNAFLYPDKTWERKIKEMVMSFQLESKYSKDEILEFYLNRINFGSGAWGVQTASQIYYGKDVDQLTLAESSLLAGLVRRPNAYSPFKNLDLAKSRQRIVLNSMVDCGFITQQEADEAYEEKLNFREPVDAPHQYGFFVDYVVDEADRILQEEGLYDNPQDAIYRGGLKIYTTMDPKVQLAAEEAYANPNSFPQVKSKNGQDIQSAMILLDHRTGDILSLIGGRSYTHKRGFNRAVDMVRQPGSAFKPVVVYGPALEMGYSPEYQLEDAPVTFMAGGKPYSPKNYDGKYRGMITMRTAVQWSVNVYAVKLADEIGIKNGINFAEKLGITSLVKAGRANDLNLSTALGGITKGVSPLELASAYGCFGNSGVRAEHHVITRIEDNAGNIIYDYRPKQTRVMKEETAWMMTDMLQTVVEAGTGTNARISGVQCAGKTGTTQNDKDAWFVGYTPHYTCAVWMGYDREETMSNTYGGSYPARIWKAAMTKAVANSKGSFKVPTGIQHVSICRKSNKVATPACPDEDIVVKVMKAEGVPKETCDLHVLANICPDTGKLATSGCPAPVQQGFLKDLAPGTPGAMPQEYCDFHGGQTVGEIVKVCTDPRHQGRIYLANIPEDGEFGGCPGEYIAEIKIDNPGHLGHCPLSEHQTHK